MIKFAHVVLSNSKDIEDHVLSFYTDLYALDNSCFDNGWVDSVIPSIVDPFDYIMLTKLPSLEEVKKVVFSLDVNSAPGPDGFGGGFYHTFWDIIGNDVFNSCLQFFIQGFIYQNLNSNVIVLIPKFKGADRVESFRPIALANFQFKVITKILADRLGIIASKVVSEQQRGFLKGRQILECICVASESFNMLDRKCFGGNIALKFDVKKAFDTLDWKFLIHVLKKFGFDSKFCHWVKVVLASVNLSISINGHMVGYFKCKKSVRQGGSPFPLAVLLGRRGLE